VRQRVTCGLLLLFIGCQAEPYELVTDIAPSPIEYLDYDQIMAEVAAYEGKVVVVDVWATDCPPCIEKLPKLAALQEKYGESFRCVTVNLDFVGLPNQTPESCEPMVKMILDTTGAQYLRNIIATEESDIMLEKLNVSAPPAVLVFDSSGQKVFPANDRNSAIEFDQLEAMISQLVEN